MTMVHPAVSKPMDNLGSHIIEDQIFKSISIFTQQEIFFLKNCKKAKLRFMYPVQLVMKYISDGYHLMIKHFFFNQILEAPALRYSRQSKWLND
jgi:hypothetical protein